MPLLPETLEGGQFLLEPLLVDIVRLSALGAGEFHVTRFELSRAPFLPLDFLEEVEQTLGHGWDREDSRNPRVGCISHHAGRQH